ncbi:MAG: helix-turn-helix domain-containing protein [Sphingomonadales bacterium]|nr:helix-turn-helix domain-containing protein [Sphingomonadales bacterium]NCP28357.1 helix-turn-helix domain-containing protein [Sphingomonadales bacterium]
MPPRPVHPFCEANLPEPISMRVNDACRFTGISRSTLYLLIASGEIEIIKLGASTLVVTESLRRFVNEKRRRAS